MVFMARNFQLRIYLGWILFDSLCTPLCDQIQKYIFEFSLHVFKHESMFYIKQGHLKAIENIWTIHGENVSQ